MNGHRSPDQVLKRQRSRGTKRVSGRSPGWKKAIVTLAPGQKIKDLFEGV